MDGQSVSTHLLRGCKWLPVEQLAMTDEVDAVVTACHRLPSSLLFVAKLIIRQRKSHFLTNRHLLYL